MLRHTVLFAFLSVVAFLGNTGAAQAQVEKHPHMHHSLHELKQSREELKEAAHNFGGHREKALKAVEASIHQIEAALKAAGDPYKGGKVGNEEYKKYTHHPHIHHAIHELKEARAELKNAAHNFGGHREAALRDVNHAIEQLELALKSVKK